jgi:hypothetical protein
MATQLTAQAAQQSLTAHVEAKGIEIFVKFGPQIGWGELQRLLDDRAYVRYPCAVVFDAAQLNPGEFVYPMPKGTTPEDGFTVYVHPMFMLELSRVPALVLYHLVAVNYGDFASAEDAETFGAAALGLTRDEYYALLCEAAAQVGGSEDEPAASAPCSGSCSCG